VPWGFYIPLKPEVEQTIGFCRLSSSAVMAGRCFFDPVIQPALDHRHRSLVWATLPASGFGLSGISASVLSRPPLRFAATEK